MLLWFFACRVAGIHGDMDQHTRMGVLAGFKVPDLQGLTAECWSSNALLRVQSNLVNTN